MHKIIITITRPEGYEDVAPELVAEDFLFNRGDGWEYEVIDEAEYQRLISE